ncbi:MAG: hypothetical protein JXA71_09695 [Chitinispirillaceae bacterium]|nr:hypothetical protein [Chitinispirillaceae bacterium]
MTFQHKELAAGRWKKLPFLEQMANVGGEIERTLNWKRKGNEDYSRRAFERALELLDLTIGDEKNRRRLKEIVRAREALADHFAFDNAYRSTDSSWQKYFYCYAFAAQNGRHHGENP